MKDADNEQPLDSWVRLQKLVELQGESAIDIANALDVELSVYLDWSETGVPADKIIAICDYFNLPAIIFTQPVSDSYALAQLIQSTQFPDYKNALLRRLNANKSSQAPTLDLSGLLLSEIPVDIFSFHWLKVLDLSGNKLETLPAEILLLDQLETLNISDNFIDILPAIVVKMTKLTSFIYANNPLKLTPQFKQPLQGLEQLTATFNTNPHVLVMVESITLANCRLLNLISTAIERTHNAKIKTLTDTLTQEDLAAATMIIYVSDASQPADIAEQTQQILATVSQDMLVPMVIIVKDEPNSKAKDSEKSRIMRALFSVLGPRQLPISLVFASDELKLALGKKLAQIANDKQRPKVLIKQLVLSNIGVYEHLVVEFDPQISVLIGLNGAGKSTVLKAIALAILGVTLSGYSSEDFGNLLRIVGMEGSQTVWQPKGEITLVVQIGDNVVENSINIEYDTTKEKVVAYGSAFTPLFAADKQLITLILGISEQRNMQSKVSKQPIAAVHLPKPRDLLPLLDNNEQTRITDFESWLANLAFQVSQGQYDSQTPLDLSFAVFSALMSESITFAGLTSVDPIKLWIAHQDPKQTVPLRLASQGYQAVMNWVGGIIQRMFEAYAEASQPLHCPAIILIDEIDQLLHLKWQQRILQVLAKEFFPNTQWIITTHSPMVLTGLDSHQVIQLHKDHDKLIAEPNTVDLWMWQYGDIVSQLFDVMPEPQSIDIDRLTQQVEQLEQRPASQRTASDDLLLSKLNDRLTRAIKSREQTDQLFRESEKLRKQQQTLATLIQQFSQQQDLD